MRGSTQRPDKEHDDVDEWNGENDEGDDPAADCHGFMFRIVHGQVRCFSVCGLMAERAPMEMGRRVWSQLGFTVATVRRPEWIVQKKLAVSGDESKTGKAASSKRVRQQE